jgi:CHAD domain-containing protein
MGRSDVSERVRAAEMLALPAPHAVRVVAMARLAEVRAAYARYEGRNDDGLHELRVALRTLRSWLRAYRGEVKDTLRSKTRRRLSALARATSGARDAEVNLLWIGSKARNTRGTRAGRDHVTKQLRRESNECARRLRSTLGREFPKVMHALTEELTPRPRHRAGTRTMATVTRTVLRRHADRLVLALRRAAPATDIAPIHRARIWTKRLRYVLEAFNVEPDVAALEQYLAELQDTLGVVCDSHQIACRLVREIGDAAAVAARRSARTTLRMDDDESIALSPPAGVRAGLMQLARRAVESQGEARDSMKTRWGARRVARRLATLAAIAQSS